ncbi:PREDICTED: uncharacterized protein LOC105364607 [Ceratosolen solmsi marchali]|uniref:Uncharacterized protein LOC105364607 n=1 Tax=Ceratosolen solmsi marchali TaxID=326594 RepID=A0AAJ6YMQ6_9HYME|nr:PREDICTED: uncharacterized protein LOC105364607 [Ceratosolen solmsi marchali]
MGAEMRRLRLTKLLLFTFIPLIVGATDDGLTTVLLVPARPGKSTPPVGLLSKTARTFVQDGASTEYATQILGTTLDNGRFYAKILSTSSRIFYDRESPADPSSPYVVYPSATLEDNWSSQSFSDDAPAAIFEATTNKNENITIKEDLNELKDNDIFNKREHNDVRLKPAKVRTDNLPTYTIKQDYTLKGSDSDLEEDQPKIFRPRVPKIFRPQPKVLLKKQDAKPLATVTYHGFADFVTTVGDTVIVFSPSTAPVPVGRPATTIKGDATLRPDDGVAVLKIRPSNVISDPKKTETIPIKNRNFTNDMLHKGPKQTNSNRPIDLQPSTGDQQETDYIGQITSPLLLVPDVKTGLQNPTGLLKVIDSTATMKGITTHYVSSIYGTYIGTNYAQIVHTSSNVYFYPEESTKGYNLPNNDENDSLSSDIIGDSGSTQQPDTTDDTLTTIKEVLAKEVTTENELGNDIIPRNQGRSIKGSSPKNQFPIHKGHRQTNSDDKLSLSTRLLPSTVYKTFTYYTTFFIPGKGQTSTSIKSREVTSSEVNLLPELILPTSLQSVNTASAILPATATNKVEISSNIDLIENKNNAEKQEIEEIQLIFKTIFTTFTYLTTFYDDSTTSISSRKVTATNVVTQTIDPGSTLIDVDLLINNEEPISILPTKVSDVSFTNSNTKTIETQNIYNNNDDNYETTEQITENILTTVADQLTTIEDQSAMEIINESDKDKDDDLILLEPSPISTASLHLSSEQLKTYYTTYTYFTTIIVDDESEIETRTEVFSNIISENIQPTSVFVSPEIISNTKSAKAAPPPEILAYLEALNKQKSPEEALSLAKMVQEQAQATTEETNEVTTENSSLFTTVDDITILDDVITTEKISNDGEVVGSMKTDVTFSSSAGESTVLDVIDKKNNVPEDQELSETNHHDVEPAPTLLLQTSYTTYTYFTTMYNGDATDVASRLKTVTNVVTETIRPTAVMQRESKTFQPLTYFTTFTYWTTFIKGDETATTSREETVSNILTSDAAATPSIQLDVVKTYRPFVLATPVHRISTELKATSDNEVTSPNVLLKEIPTIKVNELSSTISPDPMTLYTTYTYFTTSYIGNSTILKSRLETITSVSYPDDLIVKATPRLIGGPAPSSQIIHTEEKSIQPSKITDLPMTGLLSTIRLSEVNAGTTTHFMTDIYGTYIDGLYAQVVETSSKIELRTPVHTPSITSVLPTGILSLNKGTIIDADEISTIYYTTKQIGTSINDLYAKVIESTSITKINEEKLATRIPVHGHRTGLVRLIKGSIEANDTTTYYQSRVIGTSIDGRYAQIIESTSSYLFAQPSSTLNIAASSTQPPNYATAIPEISPFPAVVQSSISEDHTVDVLNNDSEPEENENEDEEDDQKLKKKSRLTFSSRKRTSSAPPIRPFASRSRPTFNPKRKPQGATTITRSDITPTITATLAGKGSRFASSRGRAISSVGSPTINSSSSRRFSGRRSSLVSASTFATNYPSVNSRSRGLIRATTSSIYSGSRRGSTLIRGSSARPTSRASSSVLSPSSTRFRPGIRPSSTLSKISPTIKQDDQEDNANEFTTDTLVTEEIPVIEESDEGETIFPNIQTTTELSKKVSNPLLRFRRPPAFGSGIRTTTPKTNVITTTPKRANSLSRQNVGNRAINNRSRPAITTLTTRSRQGQSSLFPPRSLFGRKPDTTETPVESKGEIIEDEDEGDEEQENFEDKPVVEIVDNDYEGSEQKEIAPSTNQKSITLNSTKFGAQIRPFTKIGRSRRVRRQTRILNSRFRRPTAQISSIEDRIDIEMSSSKEDVSKVPINNYRYGNRGRSISSSSRSNLNGNKEDKSSEEYIDTSLTTQSRLRSKPGSNRNTLRIKPTVASSPNRQFTLRDKESTSSIKTNYKRPVSSSSRNSNLRMRNNSRSRTGNNRYQDTTNSRRTSTRISSRNGGRTANRRVVPSRGRISSHEDYRDFNDFDRTITVTHYVPTEVTIPVVNNGVTEKRNIITAQASTEIIGPDRYSTIINNDGRDIVVLASEITGTNFQGQIEITRFVIHETPTTKVSHMLTSSGARRFSQPVIVPSTIYSIENVVSTIRPSISDNSPLANILLSQLLLGQFGQQNPLASGVSAHTVTQSTRYDTRATTYLTTITKNQSTVIPLTFRGKEILTTLIDSSTDIVTATELITDTVIVTPTIALPAANLNSLLLLLQQPQTPQQSNPLLDPLFAVAPLLTQSNTLPGEFERRNQPVDFDYKPESYEDLSDEDIDKTSKPRGKSNTVKMNEKETPEINVVTLYISGRRPGEFSTVLSTFKIGEESTSTKIKRHINEATVDASLSPSLQSASEPAAYTLAGSEEPIDAHAPTQSLESVVGDVGRHISTSI